MTRNLDETFIQGEIMANGILPTLPVVPIVRKILGKKMGEIKNKTSSYSLAENKH